MPAVFEHRFVASHYDVQACFDPLRITELTLPARCALLRRRSIYVVWSDVTESVVTIRSPFCGYNLAQRVELVGEDLPCYSNKIQPVSLWKCPRGHQPADKGYLTDIRVTNISKSFTHKMATETSWHRYGTKLRHSHPMYTPPAPGLRRSSCTSLLLSIDGTDRQMDGHRTIA